MEIPELETTAFLGRTTAGVTHELQNVLAIIKESSGLMRDLIFLSDETSDHSRDRFQRSFQTIDNQVNRGVQLLNNLNRLAHTLKGHSGYFL